MTHPTVLLADPDPRAWGDLAELLEEAGCRVQMAQAADELERRLADESFDVLLTEVQLLGRRVLELARRSPGRPEVMLLDTFGEEGDGSGAMRAGAFDVLPRPASSEQCLLGVQRALEQRRVENENRKLRRETADGRGLGDVVTRSRRMQRALDLVRTVADTRVTLLIEGESGTGKTMVARALHDASPRRDAPFVVVNCGALPDALLESELFGHVKGAFTGAVADRVGRFEAADGGTLFLDEINSASLDLQVKLLRAIESGEFEPLGGRATKKVDVRVVAAANRNLMDEVAAERFRDDLYWRLKVVAVELPPLRERPADVVALAERFVESAARDHGRDAAPLDASAVDALLRHDWPGNVRELRHAVERAVLVRASGPITAEHLPDDVRAAAGARGEGAPQPATTALAGAPVDEPVRVPARPEAAAPDASGGESGREPRCATGPDGDGPRGPAPLDRGPLEPSAVPGPGGTTLDAIPLGPLKEMLAICERRFVERALAATDGSRKRTSALLEVNRGTLFNKMRRYGLLRETSGEPRSDDAR